MLRKIDEFLLTCRPLREDDKLTKPQQTSKAHEFERQLEAGLGSAEGSGCLSLKSNGCSGLLNVMYGSDETTATLRYRTESGGEIMDIPNIERYLKPPSLCDAITAICLKVEITPVLVIPGQEPLELGHNWTARAVQTFKENHKENKGPLHLWLRIFGLEYIEKNGRKQKSRKSTLSFLKTLTANREDGNDLLHVVPYEEFRIKKSRYGLEFRLGNKLIATGMDNLRKYAIEKARVTAAEGYVLQVHERYMLPPHGGPSSNPDSLGQKRDVASIKLKEEFAFTLLAVKAQDERTPDKTSIFLYERCQDKGKVRYVADVSDNARIAHIMRYKTAVVVFETDEQRKEWFLTDFDKLSVGGVILDCKSAGVTVKYFLSGVKQYDARAVNTHTTGMLRVQDLDKLSNVQEVADKNPHFVAIQEGVRTYERLALGGEAGAAAEQRAVKRQKRASRQVQGQTRTEPVPAQQTVFQGKAYPAPQAMSQAKSKLPELQVPGNVFLFPDPKPKVNNQTAPKSDPEPIPEPSQSLKSEYQTYRKDSQQDEDEEPEDETEETEDPQADAEEETPASLPY
jgi:hypothetical protein